MSLVNSGTARQSKKILLSPIARMAVGPDKQARTEPVAGTITLNSTVKGLRVVTLASDCSRGTAISLTAHDGTYTIVLPTDRQA